MRWIPRADLIDYHLGTSLARPAGGSDKAKRSRRSDGFAARLGR